MCEDRNQVIDKIRKLLAMSSENGASEAEACQAALMAQRLIAENDVADYELYEEIKHEDIVSVESNYSKYLWSHELATVVANNYRCKCYLNQKYDYNPHNMRGYSKKYVVFMGYETDANAAKLVFDYLYDTCRELSKNLRSGNKNLFAHGFCMGVKDVLEKQCKELMLVVSKDVVDAYNRMSLSTSHESVCRYGSDDIMNQGRTAGQNAVKSRRLEHGYAGQLTA